MRLFFLAALSIWMLGVSAASAANDTVQNAIDGFIRPAYKDFAASAAALADDMASLCAVPDKAHLAGARHAFLRTVTQWSRIETVRFGPVTQENRLERILYWPDRKGIGLRQVQAAIAGDDPSFEQARTLAGKSVAVQGLGALEFVLHGAGADDLPTDKGARRCRYGRSIAENVSGIARDVADEWAAPGGFAASWANPSPKNALYRTDTEAITELFEVFVHGLEQVRDTRLSAFLGKTPEGDKPRLAIFWRSNGTARAIGANIAGLRDLFEASGLGSLATGENAYIARSIGFEFANAQRSLRDLGNTPVAEALKDGGLRGKLDYLCLVTSSLSELFGVRLAAALGLSAGFSSLDGD